MLHNYVPSGSGRDNFIFNDDVFKYGRQGINVKLNPISKTSHDLEFWKNSESIKNKAAKKPRIKFMQFPTERKPTVEDSLPYKPRERPNKGKNFPQGRQVISGYQGHVQSQQFVVGKPQHRIVHDKEVQDQVSSLTNTKTTSSDYSNTVSLLPSEDNQLTLPSFQRMKMNVLKKRLDRISEGLDNKDHVVIDSLKNQVPTQQKKRVDDKKGSIPAKYLSGYSGHVPRRFIK